MDNQAKNKHSIVVREYYATGEREGNYFTGVSYIDYLVSPRSFEIQVSEYPNALDGHKMVFPRDNIITVRGEVILQMDESGNTKPVGDTLYFDVVERVFPDTKEYKSLYAVFGKFVYKVTVLLDWDEEWDGFLINQMPSDFRMKIENIRSESILEEIDDD